MKRREPEGEREEVRLTGGMRGVLMLEKDTEGSESETKRMEEK